MSNDGQLNPSWGLMIRMCRICSNDRLTVERVSGEMRSRKIRRKIALLQCLSVVDRFQQEAGAGSAHTTQEILILDL